MTEPDYKFIENYFLDKFYRPYIRKLGFIYFGFDQDESIFVLSNTEDTKFKYCEPLQTTGLIKILNKDHLEQITLWFRHLKINTTVPSILSIDLMMQAYKDMSWDDPSIVISQNENGCVSLSDVLIAHPIDTYFTLTRLQTFIKQYQNIFFDRNQKSLVIDVPPVSTKVITATISNDILNESGIINTPGYDINLILLPGLDILQTKSLIKKKTLSESGLRLWANSSAKCINYGGFYEDPDISLCVVRDNIYVFPKPK